MSRVVAHYLADTSAWYWSGRVGDRWTALLEDDEIAMCTPVALELLVSARSPSHYRAVAAELAGLTWVSTSAASEEEARRTQAALAARSQQRGVTPADLFVAALAATNNLVLLHYDRHFEAIARVTAQPTEWLARRGSLK